MRLFLILPFDAEPCLRNGFQVRRFGGEIQSKNKPERPLTNQTKIALDRTIGFD